MLSDQTRSGAEQRKHLSHPRAPPPPASPYMAAAISLATLSRLTLPSSGMLRLMRRCMPSLVGVFRTKEGLSDALNVGDGLLTHAEHLLLGSRCVRRGPSGSGPGGGTVWWQDRGFGSTRPPLRVLRRRLMWVLSTWAMCISFSLGSGSRLGAAKAVAEVKYRSMDVLKRSLTWSSWCSSTTPASVKVPRATQHGPFGSLMSAMHAMDAKNTGME
mmetsp:Transcript_50348/g.113159  ORF Transcript_50348/g.113159 Transcript_50348/m.113159 type:complete len:215 (+) Transcript_50348:3-647(+)